MYKLKLTKCGEVVESDGSVVVRLQSQLWVGRDACDYILKEGQLYVYNHGPQGFAFYPCNYEFEIVEPIKD